MQIVRVNNLSMSLDGYTAGPDQTLENPLGRGGQRLHEWIFATRTGRSMIGQDGGEEGVDDAFFARGLGGADGVGATIMGRNMFGPVRGPWPDDSWKGWWEENPPFHHPVFVLTNHRRDPLEMEGGTTFHFVTDGIQSARAAALEAADGANVRVGGGASTVRQFLQAGLIDELHLAVVPILLGQGDRLFEDMDGAPELDCVGLISTAAVTHVTLARRGG